MNNDFFVEVNCFQKHYHGERICGDVFISKFIKEENRVVFVLSDGMGHGVKANVLATLTSTMALNFAREHRDPARIAEIIMKTLPVCSERKISYSTFSVVDIDYDGEAWILEYDNPPAQLFRAGRRLDIKWNTITVKGQQRKGMEIRSFHFYPQKEDRLFLFSDGIMQSGMGTPHYPFGWGSDEVSRYISDCIQNEPFISASKFATRIVNKAHQNDVYQSHDDTSCATVYFREPRRLLICTGPPYETYNDIKLAEVIQQFPGQKIICGATTADIVSRELGLPITDSFEFDDPDLPPVSYMDGFELVTEGILTLGKVAEILRLYNNNFELGKGPANQIVKYLLESDEINFIIGTRINIAHQDPNLPVELEIRRTVVKRVAGLLEEKFIKEVKMKYI
jgi:hypothetical protein